MKQFQGNHQRDVLIYEKHLDIFDEATADPFHPFLIFLYFCVKNNIKSKNLFCIH